jgi:hypothetical protein
MQHAASTCNYAGKDTFRRERRAAEMAAIVSQRASTLYVGQQGQGRH